MCNSRATINQPNQYHHGANPIIKISTFSYQLSTYWPTYPPASSSPPKVQIPNHQPPVKDDQSVKDAKKPDGNSQAVLLPPLLGQPAGHLLLLPGQTPLPILSHLHKVSTMLQPYNDDDTDDDDDDDDTHPSLVPLLCSPLLLASKLLVLPLNSSSILNHPRLYHHCDHHHRYDCDQENPPPHPPLLLLHDEHLVFCSVEIQL